MIICSYSYNATSTYEYFTLSLHDALPISARADRQRVARAASECCPRRRRAVFARGDAHAGEGSGCALFGGARGEDRKSTRLNSSHLVISYAVFCLKKKNSKMMTG